MLTKYVSWLKSRTATEWFLIYIIFIFTALILTVISNLTPPSVGEGPICLTKECVLAAGEILQNIDEKINPCEDFYGFACGNFIKKSFIPEDDNTIDARTPERKKVERFFREEFERPTSSADLRPVLLLKTIYQSCTSGSSLDSNLDFLKKSFKKLGGWPVVENKRWNEKLFNYTKILTKLFQIGLDNFSFYFMNAEIQPDLANKSQIILVLDLPDDEPKFLEANFNTSSRHFDSLHEYYVSLATLFGASPKSASAEMEQVIFFQRNLAKVRAEASPLESDWRTVEELQSEITSISWHELIFSYLKQRKMALKSRIRVVSIAFLRSLENLLQKSRKRVVGNYIFLKILLNYVKHLPQEYRQVELKYLKTEIGQTRLPPRWSECVTELKHLPNALSWFYLRKHFDSSSFSAAKELVENIKNVFVLHLQNLNWIDEETMPEARQINFSEKFQRDVSHLYEGLELNSRACYLNVLLNISLFNHANYIKTLRKPSSSSHLNSYSARENEITSLVQKSVLNPLRPSYLNYGAFGFLISRELVRGFVRNRNSSLKTVEQEAECFIKQLDNLEETAAVDLAYKSYLNSIIAGKNDFIEQKLPGLSLTAKQLFWVSAASLGCATSRTEKTPNAQVLDGLKNSEFFSRDFQCGEKCAFY